MFEHDIRICQFIEASDIVPKEWAEWFWEQFSEGAPFSWGDNNRTLIVAEDFARYAEELEFPGEYNDATVRREYNNWIKELYALNQMYIDLEN